MYGLDGETDAGHNAGALAGRVLLAYVPEVEDETAYEAVRDTARLQSDRQMSQGMLDVHFVDLHEVRKTGYITRIRDDIEHKNHYIE